MSASAASSALPLMCMCVCTCVYVYVRSRVKSAAEPVTNENRVIAASEVAGQLDTPGRRRKRRDSAGEPLGSRLFLGSGGETRKEAENSP